MSLKNLFPVRNDESFCPVCNKKLSSKFLIKGGFLYLKRKCKTHVKEMEILHKYDDLLPYYLWNSDIKLLINKEKYWKGIRSVDVLVTRKCNSDCKVCFIKYGKENYEEMSIDTFKELLNSVNGSKIILNGGEVTLRKDLKKLIRLTLNSGNYPVVYTNGLKLSELSYLKSLKKAGLKEVVISFEGFRKEIYEKIRGGGYQLDLVLKALKNLEKEKIKTSIYCTVVKGINDDQVVPILKYSASHKFIWATAFKPVFLSGVSPYSNINQKNLISYSELIKIIGKEVKGVNKTYLLSAQKMFYSIQKKSSIYFSWLEIPTIFVRRIKGEFKLFFPSKWVSKISSNKLFSSIFSLIGNYRFSYNTNSQFNGNLLKIENLLYKCGVGKIVLGTISPYVSPYITSSPTLKQFNGKLVLSSYLAW